MFGTNKDVIIQRINTNNIFANNSTLKCRYSPKKFTSLRELETKQNHITYNLLCDQHDIRIKDKVIHGARNFIISGIYEYSDGMGEHLEILMLENNTRHHESIDIISLDTNQNNYDNLMGEWISGKNTTTRTLNVLVDSAKLLKGQFIKMLPGGKIEDTELVVTMTFPESIDKSDKIVYNGSTYEIKWVIDFPHQIAIGINKYIKDYET